MSPLADADRDGVPARDEDDPSGAHQPRGRHRVVVGYLAVAAMLPYLLLKAAWITGSTIGFATESSVDSRVRLGGNIVTAGMELVVIVVVLAFTHDWGMRLPAWSVLLPAWVGTGLLAPFVVAGPLLVVSVATEASPVGDDSFEPWVGPVVYSSFGAQAVGIALTFALYARARWPRVLRSRGGCRSAGHNPFSSRPPGSPLFCSGSSPPPDCLVRGEWPSPCSWRSPSCCWGRTGHRRRRTVSRGRRRRSCRLAPGRRSRRSRRSCPRRR
jgi:hypothetical protein